jgi:hypothetical protein
MNWLVEKPDEVIMKTKSHLQWQQQNIKCNRLKLLASAVNGMQSQRRSSKHNLKCSGSGSLSNDSCSETEKHCCKNTQEFCSGHKVEFILRDCGSTALVESGALTGTVAAGVATAMILTSTLNHCVTVRNQQSLSKESLYFNYVSTTQVCGDW